MTQEELNKIIEQHQHWILKDVDGWEEMRADLRDKNLYGLRLDGASLDGALLDGAEKIRLGQILTEPMTGYKKTREGVVITAEIPVGAIVF